MNARPLLMCYFLAVAAVAASGAHAQTFEPLRIGLIALSLFCFSFLAASAAKHPAIGPVKFGMTDAELRPANAALMAELRKEGQTQMTAAVIRKHFVVRGTKYRPKLAVKDAAIPVNLSFSGPVVSEVCASSQSYDTSEYSSEAENAWMVLRDIGESKFGRPVETSEYPNLFSFLQNPEWLVTDVWDTGEVRVELGLYSDTSIEDPNFCFSVVLRAIDAASLETIVAGREEPSGMPVGSLQSVSSS